LLATHTESVSNAAKKDIVWDIDKRVCWLKTVGAFFKKSFREKNQFTLKEKKRVSIKHNKKASGLHNSFFSAHTLSIVSFLNGLVFFFVFDCSVSMLHCTIWIGSHYLKVLFALYCHTLFVFSFCFIVL